MLIDYLWRIVNLNDKRAAKDKIASRFYVPFTTLRGAAHVVSTLG